jgi:hypothetical protein
LLQFQSSFNSLVEVVGVWTTGKTVANGLVEPDPLGTGNVERMSLPTGLMV